MRTRVMLLIVFAIFASGCGKTHESNSMIASSELLAHLARHGCTVVRYPRMKPDGDDAFECVVSLGSCGCSIRVDTVTTVGVRPARATMIMARLANCPSNVGVTEMVELFDPLLEAQRDSFRQLLSEPQVVRDRSHAVQQSEMLGDVHATVTLGGSAEAPIIDVSLDPIVTPRRAVQIDDFVPVTLPCDTH